MLATSGSQIVSCWMLVVQMQNGFSCEVKKKAIDAPLNP